MTQTMSTAPVTARPTAVPAVPSAVAAMREAVLMQAPVGVVAVDTKGVLLLVNDYFCDFVGRTQDELIGTSIVGLLHPDERAAGLSKWARTLVNRDTSHRPTTSDAVRVLYRAKDGSRLPADVVWTMTEPDSTGAQYSMLYMLRVNDPDKIEDRLAEVSHRFELAFELTPVAIAVLDLEGRFRQANKAMEQLLGYSEAEFKSMYFNDINHPGDMAASQRTYDSLLSGKADQHEGIKRYVRKDGTVVFCRRMAAMTRDASGNPSYLLVIAEPIDIAGQSTG